MIQFDECFENWVETIKYNWIERQLAFLLDSAGDIMRYQDVPEIGLKCSSQRPQLMEIILEYWMMNVLPTYPRMFTDRWCFLLRLFLCTKSNLEKVSYSCSSNSSIPFEHLTFISSLGGVHHVFCSPNSFGKICFKQGGLKTQIDPFKTIHSSIPPKTNSMKSWLIRVICISDARWN